VEAVRRLLDNALKSRDTYKTVVDRFLSRLVQTRIPSEIAKDVLVGHPLVEDIKFRGHAIEFGIKEGLRISISKDGFYSVTDGYDNVIETNVKKVARKRDPMDDEIPF
jgi:hypothetical protein